MPRARTVLVMWEYLCEYSPVWGRSPDLDVGPIDVAALGVSAELREDLADWNAAREVAADGGGGRHAKAEWHGLQVDAFLLAARLQRELGDEWTVWCLAGGGDGALRDAGAFAYTRRTGGPQLLLRTTGLWDWTPAGSTGALNRLPAHLRSAWERWAETGASTAPSAFRADALELAGALQEVTTRGRVLWFGGQDVP